MGAQAVRLSNVDIDDALRDKDFEVLFQPIFDLGNGALARVETFIRWRHPSLGVLPPGAFISFFETQGRMSELTRYVLSEALSAYQGWRGSYTPGFSINLALSDLSDESFASHFTILLRDRGFPAELVTLECPMPPVDADVGTTSRQLQRLAETGARLAIEVRGRANDFLKTVRPFPFAEIKTGGAAILRFARTVRGPGLSAISELLELAAEQNAAITAVGVEDQASLSALRGLGFAAAQGNHLAKVGPLAQFMPSHVNDVRALLGLDPLSSDDLAALFRTGGPKLAASAIHPDAEETEPQPETTRASQPEPRHAPEPPAARVGHEDDLVERLAARIARADTAGSSPADPAEETAKARAAAIARARRKSLARERIASRNALKAKAEAAAQADLTPPREMQERLSREFEGFTAEPPAPCDEFEIADETALRK
ncbi:MAG: EAL domain-containing protein, partial [Pseudomonadota bacterium]